MAEEKLITGTTEDEIWQQLNSDFQRDPNLLEYYAVLDQNGKRVLLDIDIDPGGGFESGYATTTFKAPLTTTDDFKFAIHEEGFLDELGKFFGMQDVVLGYEEFDKKLIVKTNNEEKAKILFSNEEVRKTIQSLKGFTLHTKHTADNDEKEASLELTIEDGITDTNLLRQIYHAFYSILNSLEMK